MASDIPPEDDYFHSVSSHSDHNDSCSSSNLSEGNEDFFNHWPSFLELPPIEEQEAKSAPTICPTADLLVLTVISNHILQHDFNASITNLSMAAAKIKNRNYLKKMRAKRNWQNKPIPCFMSPEQRNDDILELELVPINEITKTMASKELNMNTSQSNSRPSISDKAVGGYFHYNLSRRAKRLLNSESFPHLPRRKKNRLKVIGKEIWKNNKRIKIWSNLQDCYSYNKLLEDQYNSNSQSSCTALSDKNPVMIRNESKCESSKVFPSQKPLPKLRKAPAVSNKYGRPLVKEVHLKEQIKHVNGSNHQGPRSYMVHPKQGIPEVHKVCNKVSTFGKARISSQATIEAKNIMYHAAKTPVHDSKEHFFSSNIKVSSQANLELIHCPMASIKDTND